EAELVSAHRRLEKLDHRARRELEDLRALHLEEVVASLDRLVRRGRATASPWDMDEIGADAVASEVVVEDARLLALGAREHDRARAITEEDAGLAVLPIDESRERLGPDDEHVAEDARADETRADGERVDEAGAGRVEIERSRLRCAEPALHVDRGRRAHRVR